MKTDELIIHRILQIPLDKWSGYETKLNDVNISFHYNSCGYPPFVKVGDEIIFSRELYELEDSLRKRKQELDEIKRNQKLNDIYEKIK